MSDGFWDSEVPTAEPDLVWIAPPQWSQAPSGWTPPAGWSAPPDFADPGEWEFWRVAHGCRASSHADDEEADLDEICEFAAEEWMEDEWLAHDAIGRRAMRDIQKRSLQTGRAAVGRHPLLELIASRLKTEAIAHRSHNGAPVHRAAAIDLSSAPTMTTGLLEVRWWLATQVVAEERSIPKPPMPDVLSTSDGRDRLSVDLQLQLAWTEELLAMAKSAVETYGNSDSQEAVDHYKRDRRTIREWMDALARHRLPAQADPRDVSIVRRQASGTAELRAAADRAEEVAAAFLRSIGYKSAAKTPGTGDFGLDVVGHQIAAQVKYQTANVGRPVLQGLVGAGSRGGNNLACFARIGYSAGALAFAAEHEIALFTIDLDSPGSPSVEPANQVAEHWMQ